MVLLVLLFFFPLDVGGAGLRARIEATASEAHGRVGVACSLPGKALDCNLHSDAKLPMQSVYKLPIAVTVLHIVEQGRLRVDQEVEFQQSDLISPDQHSPLRDRHPRGGVKVPLRELLRLAVCESDGVASDILLRTIGGPPVVDSYIRNLGISGISIRDSEKTIGADVQVQYRNYAEPRAIITLLRLIDFRSPLSPKHTELLLQWMTQTHTGEHRLKAQLPANTVVAHKTGTSGQDNGITHATNDTGLITLPDGRKLAIAVFIADSSETEVVREHVIAQIAREIWDAANSGENTREKP